MNDWTRFLLSSFLFGLFAVVVWRARIVPRVTRAFLGPKNVRDLIAWEDRIEELMQEHTRTCLHKAALECELFQLIDRMPATFVHPVEQGIQFGHAVEQSLRLKAEQLGIYKPEGASETEARAEIVPLPKAPDHEWKGGRLIPRRSR